MIRCGRLAVEGEEEVIAVSPKISKPRQRVGKSSNNPYSSRGLDKFAKLNDELSAKREFYASKTSTPEELVRFAHSSRGWMPVVFKNGGHAGPNGVSILPPIRPDEHKESKNRSDGNDIGEGEINGFAHSSREWTPVELKNGGHGGSDGVLILPPIRTKKDKKSKNRSDGNRGYGNDIGEGEINGSAKKGKSVSVIILPWWSVYLKTAVFGVLGLSIILARKSALRAAAMAAVIVVGYLQMWLQGFVTLVSIFSKPFLYCRGDKRSAKGIVQAPPENKVAGECGSEGETLISLTAPCSPTVFYKDSRSQEHINQLESEKLYNEKNKLERTVSMAGRAAKKPIRLQEAEIFLKRRKASSGAIDATAIATVMIIVLFFLVFYGRLPAICFASAWWYVLPKFRTNGSNAPPNGRVNMDLQSREHRKKIHR
ncbi:hypothetical protein SUGI_0575280 [Cryptomeria japonica]|uniref:uncharacterized protein LOC131042951 n=1 Tax=Cryptomeria japonica TaxID=3369 RepID=UPI002408D46B|nr:uncharacterized protein LOC131042951 [Cryptomeria japonica]GLJ29177.1 hypothetical protein SUGI_0575280 [Cryptomeria japonica]